MCKLILEAAHLNGTNYISPLDNMCLLSAVHQVYCICVGILEKERLLENPTCSYLSERQMLTKVQELHHELLVEIW